MSIPNIQQLRKESARGKWPWWLWTLVIGGSIVVLVVIALFLAAPPFVRSQLEKELTARLHRPAKVAKVKINPLALSVTIEGLEVRTKTNEEFLAWKRLYVNFEGTSLLSHQLRFSDVSLEGFVFHAYLSADGKLNFDDLIQEYAGGTPKSEAPAKPPGKPWPVTVDTLHFDCQSIAFTDTSRGATFKNTFVPIAFTMSGFHTDSSSLSKGEFSAVTESGEKFTWTGGVSLKDLVSEGTVELSGLSLPKYAPYYRSLVRFELLDGRAGFKARYRVALEQGVPVASVEGGEFHLEALKVAPVGSVEPLLGLAHLDVTGVSASTKDRVVTVQAVGLSGGTAQIHREPGRIDLIELLSPAQKGGASAPSPAQAGGQPWRVDLGGLSLEKFSIDFYDTTGPRAARLRAEDLGFTLGPVSTASLATRTPFAFSTKVVGGGVIGVKGEVAPLPLAFKLDANVETFPFALVSPYIEAGAPLKLLGGSVSITASAEGSLPASGAPVLRANAEVSLADVATVDQEKGEPLAGFRQLAVRGIEFTTEPAQKLVIHEIALIEPKARVALWPDKSMNVAPKKASATAKAPSAETLPGAKLPLSIAIDKVTIEQGTFSFEDQSLQPHVHTGVEQFGGTISGLSSANIARADVALEGKVDGSAPFQINGQINPLSEDAFTDLKVAFRGIDLLPVGPYVGKYAGRELAKGSASLDVKLKFSKRTLDASNVLTLDQFTLGANVDSPDATKLPVGLALALLRDTKGQIVVDLPVQGSIDDPNFNIWRVVGRVLGNILVKAATSPFSLIGSMFGGGGDELGLVQLEAGSSVLPVSETKKLDTVAKALAQRPGLSVDVGGVYDAANDSVVLRETFFRQKLQKAVWEEMRKVNVGVEIPAPEAIVVSPETEARLVTAWYQQLVAENPGAATADLPPPPPPAPKVEEKPGLLRRLVRFFAGTNNSGKTATAATPAKAPGKAASVAPKSEGTAPAPLLPPVPEMRARVLNTLVVDDNALKRLASDRADAIRKYLVDHGAASDRVFLVPVSGSGLQVKLVLK